MKDVRGFTLVELLIVTAIVASLAGLIFAVGEPALRKSRDAQTLSNLKQISYATSLYAESEGGPPNSASRLVPTYLSDPRVLAFDNDPFPRGFANALERDDPKHGAHIPYKLSVICRNEGDREEVLSPKPLLQPGSQRGIYVDLTPLNFHFISSNTAIVWFSFKGRYRRVLEDGSIILRPYPVPSIDDSPSGKKCFTDSWLFDDYAPEQMILDCTR